VKKKESLFSVILKDVVEGRNTSSILNLNDLSIDLKKMGALCMVLNLPYANYITTVEICNCEIDDWGLMALAEFLQTNTSVQNLLLYGNQFDENGVKFILSGLQKNKTMQNIYLDSDFENIVLLQEYKSLKSVGSKTQIKTVKKGHVVKRTSAKVAFEEQLSSNLSAPNLPAKKQQRANVVRISSGRNDEKTEDFKADSHSGNLQSLENALSMVRKKQETYDNEAFQDPNERRQSVAIAHQQEGEKIDSLSSELSQNEQQMALLQQQINELRQGQSNKDTRDGQMEQRLLSLESKQQQLNDNQGMLLAMQSAEIEQQKMRILYEQRKPKVWDFYRRMHIKLEEVFIGLKSVASDQAAISDSQKGKLGVAGGGVKLCGTVVGLVPIVGESIKNTMQVVGDGMKQVDAIRMKNLRKNISLLGTLGEFQKVAEYTARLVAERYVNQIGQLRTLEEELAAIEHDKSCGKLYKKVKSKIKDKLKKGRRMLLKDFIRSPSQDFAEFLVLQLLDAMMEEKFEDIKTLPEDFLRTLVIAPENRQTTEKIQRRLSKGFGVNTLVTKKGETWFMGDICLRSGIQIGSEFFIDESAKMEPKKYGYCIGNYEEVEERGLVEDPSAKSKAHQQQVKNQTTVQASQNNKQEFYQKYLETKANRLPCQRLCSVYLYGLESHTVACHR